MNLWLLGRRMEGKGVVREFGMDMYTLLYYYFKWTNNEDLLYSTWNSAQCCVADWMEGEFRGEWRYVTESLCSLPETITALLIGYTPI